MKGQLIECDKCKFNYYENGLLKSYTGQTATSVVTGTYSYDEKGRLTLTSSNYTFDGDVTLSYLENGLLSKIKGAKVKYEYYK
jgi:hypothetical protein